MTSQFGNPVMRVWWLSNTLEGTYALQDFSGRGNISCPLLSLRPLRQRVVLSLSASYRVYTIRNLIYILISLYLLHMSPYYLRSGLEAAHIQHLDDQEAASSDAPDSSPVSLPVNLIDFPDNVPFRELPYDEANLSDEHDATWTPRAIPRTQRPPNEQKTILVLRYMRSEFSRFSLRLFLKTLFSSNHPETKNFTSIFLQHGGLEMLLDLWRGSRMGQSWEDPLSLWIVDRAALLCAREASHLTDRASLGPYLKDAEFLRVPAWMTVEFVRSFSSTCLHQWVQQGKHLHAER